MTQLFEKAFKEASKLPEFEQNTLARWLIDEILSEKKWEKAFAESEDVLDQLADEALAEHAKGKTKPLDIDRLALAAVHPVGLRRIFFRVNELLNTDAMRKGMPYYVAGRAYGVPADLPDLSGIDVYAPTMRATKKTVLDAPFSCDIKTEGWIKQQLVKLGVVGV